MTMDNQEQYYEKEIVIPQTAIKQKWYQSPVVWVTVITNTLYILKVTGCLERFGISENEYQGASTAITMIIDTIAAFNNPTSKNTFR